MEYKRFVPVATVYQPISASIRDRLHSVSATMILEPSAYQEQQLLRYCMVRKDRPFCQSTSLCDAMRLPGYVTNQDVTTWNCLSNMIFYGNYSSPCIIFFTAPLALFSVLPLILTHDVLYIFDVSYALPSVKFKHSYYVFVVDYFFPLRSFSLLCISRSAGGGFWSFRLLLLKS